MTVRIHLRQSSSAAKGHLLAWIGRFFLTAGSLLLVFCALNYFEAALFQRSEDAAFTRLAVSSPIYEPGAEPAIASYVSDAGDPAPPEKHELLQSPTENGTALSRIEIPRLGVSVMVVEGVRPRDLKLAVGHIPGTALPGESGNIGIAGHRDTFFRKLGQIRTDDRITLTTSKGQFEYTVESTRVVAPHDTEVLEASTKPTLTLVTCYPFYYVGPAPKRFIVTALRTW